MAEKLLQHTDNLSKTLQTPSLTVSEGQEVANLTCQTLQRMRNGEMFDLFWTKVLALQRKYNVDEPVLPRKRKTPRHLEVGSGEDLIRVLPKNSIINSILNALTLLLMHSRTDLINQDTGH